MNRRTNRLGRLQCLYTLFYERRNVIRSDIVEVISLIMDLKNMEETLSMSNNTGAALITDSRISIFTKTSL